MGCASSKSANGAHGGHTQDNYNKYNQLPTPKPDWNQNGPSYTHPSQQESYNEPYQQDLPVTLDDTKYKQLRKLSRNAAAEVWLVEDVDTGKRHAIKLIERGSLAKEAFIRELKTMIAMKHPHIILLRESFLMQDHLAIVMEYATQGDLLSYVRNKQYPDGTAGRLKEEHARWFMQQCIVALDYMHLLGFCSRGLSLENCGLFPSRNPDRPLLKLIDFATSKDTKEGSMADTLVGSTPYMPPEMLFPPYDAQMADLWCVGVMLYYMVVGSYPFGEVPNYAKPNVSVRYPENIRLSQELDNLIRGVLMKEPQNRFTLQDVKKHPWFTLGLPERAWAHNVRGREIPAEVDQQVEELAAQATRKAPRPR